MIFRFSTAIALIALTVPALASPPPVGSDDWNVMKPFADWVISQHDQDRRWCCDIGDGRPVDAEIRGDAWWARVTPEHWPGEPDRWVEVPGEKIVPGNPTGRPILWLYKGKVQCFAPTGGV